MLQADAEGLSKGQGAGVVRQMRIVIMDLIVTLYLGLHLFIRQTVLSKVCKSELENPSDTLSGQACLLSEIFFRFFT